MSWTSQLSYQILLLLLLQVHSKSTSNHHFFVMLDCAAFAATHQLDLSTAKPDFVSLSFYKLFGYPSGLGALIVRKEAAEELRGGKVYFGKPW